ncbi:MAG: hypothetical protein C0469_07455 [Cyanobacteria bacterium DS2.3.42]|nr:hypothetical protein [Cyanobacteria bacterium DS2.3.42]
MSNISRVANLLMWVLLYSCTASPASMAQTKTAIPAKSELQTIQESRPYVARTGAWQTWSDHIHLQPGIEKRRLFLTFSNGAEGRAKMTDLRVHLAKRPLVTFKDFADQSEATRDLTGKIGTGNTLITVEGFGPSGARLVWKLSTDKMSVSSVQPNPFKLTDTITIQGKNLPKETAGTTVNIGNKRATVLSVLNDQIKVKVPPHLPGGSHNLVVGVGSAKSESFKVRTAGGPTITWIDHISTAPHQPVVITGTGFSKVASENVVLFGKLPALIVSSTENSITCTVPEMHFPDWHVPITVKTNGLASKEKKTINIDVRVIENPQPY